MPRIITPLNDRQIKVLKPQEKAYTKADGSGLQLLVKPNGSKLWEFFYSNYSPSLKENPSTKIS